MSKATTFDLSGKRVLVTGGTRGIGREIAVAMAEHGARVTITGTGARDAEVDGFAYRRLDLLDWPSIKEAAAALDGLDVLVNNAGLLYRDDREYEPEVFEHVVSANLFGPYRVCRAFHPHLRESRGSVINLVSMRALINAAGTPAYGAAKAGLLNLTRSLAVKWGADGIRVNAIAPGPILTEMNAGLREDPAVTQAVADRIPLGRWGESHEVAGAAVYLASPAAAFTTGSCIQTDGGILA